MDEDFGTVSFTSLDQCTREEWALIIRHHEAHYAREGALADEILHVLARQKGPKLGFRVDRYEHSLQTATRALRAGEDEEFVCCALLHDIGDTLSPENHCEVSAAILRPYVSPEHLWMVENHVVFTGYYFFHHSGMDRHEHRKFKDHPAYALTMRFVRDYDAPSFDPDYDTEPVETFVPMVQRLFAQPKGSTWREADTAAA
ncbi:MAG: HD domain-containing protein [Rhizobiaceae bacterium]|nr:HD domain-containing protein [Rhizobiaceae bacterium]